MALPAVVSATLAAMPAAARTGALAWMARATGGVVSSAKAAVDYVKRNPLSSALVVEALVRYGADVSTFAPYLGKGKEAEGLIQSLISLQTKASEHSDSDNLGLDASDDDTARDKLRQDMGRVLVRAFGSLDAARKVQVALDTLKERDFEWLRVVGLPRV